MMREILCYGDSNTYGYSPYDGTRFSPEIRWTGRLQSALGPGFHVIEEGCNGRTTNYAEEEEPWKDGWTSLHAILNTHKPLDLVILMLGTNDLKDMFGAEPEDIAGNILRYANEISAFTKLKQQTEAKVMVIAPPSIRPEIVNSPFGDNFSIRSYEKCLRMPALYKKAAKEAGCIFVDASFINASKEDCLHLGAEGHREFAELIAGEVKKLFSPGSEAPRKNVPA